MDLTKTKFRFSTALPLALLIALYPSADANAGSKIFKTVDSHGNITFTDVPLLLESQVTHGFKGAAKTRQTQTSGQSPESSCRAADTSSKQRCRKKSD